MERYRSRPGWSRPNAHARGVGITFGNVGGQRLTRGMRDCRNCVGPRPGPARSNDSARQAGRDRPTALSGITPTRPRRGQRSLESSMFCRHTTSSHHRAHRGARQHRASKGERDVLIYARLIIPGWLCQCPGVPMPPGCQCPRAANARAANPDRLPVFWSQDRCPFLGHSCAGLPRVRICIAHPPKAAFLMRGRALLGDRFQAILKLSWRHHPCHDDERRGPARGAAEAVWGKSERSRSAESLYPGCEELERTETTVPATAK